MHHMARPYHSFDREALNAFDLVWFDGGQVLAFHQFISLLEYSPPLIYTIHFVRDQKQPTKAHKLFSKLIIIFC
jgi:hypothetical protein